MFRLESRGTIMHIDGDCSRVGRVIIAKQLGSKDSNLSSDKDHVLFGVRQRRQDLSVKRFVSAIQIH
ncbi:hypothetical protein AHF37_04104 [Paragonimus kellicotti]|nr:hypothetical protein AHF37_04104 [Paragonimus kellicotti]